MSLADFKIGKRPVKFQGGALEFRGICFEDITGLLRNHLDELNNLFAMYDDEEKRATMIASSGEFALRVVRDAPEMVALLIANCADEPGAIEIARRLPLPVQVDCIKVIFEQTFEESGGAKKFFDSVAGLVRSLAPGVKQG